MKKLIVFIYHNTNHVSGRMKTQRGNKMTFFCVITVCFDGGSLLYFMIAFFEMLFSLV